MAIPCPSCLPLDCDLTEDQDLYSIESALFPFVLNCPPGFDCHNTDSFKMLCCGQLLQVDFPPNATVDDKNTLRQELVNQCGVRQLYCGQDIPQNPPNDPTQLYQNVTKICTVFCPDGAPFTFIVQAGTFASSTQADADKQASAYACQQAGLRKLCLGPISKCLCVGSAFSGAISHTGGIPPFKWSVFSGALPDGLSLNQSGVISGTPTANGSFTFTIQVTAVDGSYMRKPYSISVLEIATTTITGYSIGTPYTFQMVGAGGSGNFQWSIASGALPDGLTMTDAGLISGTPTADGTNPIVFTLVDLSCEAAQKSAFPPRISLSARSTTQVATLLGYSEYSAFVSSPPKKYKTLTWTGSGKWVYTFQSGIEWQTFQWDYAGAGAINTSGGKVSSYTKIKSHAYFPNALAAVGNFAGDSIVDSLFPGLLTINSMNGQFVPQSGAHGESVGTGTIWSEDANDPNQYFSGLPAVISDLPNPAHYVAKVDGTFNYSATLSDEYTDAEALGLAKVFVGNGTTAQNSPRTTGFVSSFTTVAFTLSCSGLVDGKSYLVSVDLWDSSAGTTLIRQYGFVANSTTIHTITDVVPTPLPGRAITVRNPRIAFSP